MTDTVPGPRVRIDARKARSLLRKVVKGREDYVYSRPAGVCVYTFQGQPSCLIGHALIEGGCHPSDLEGQQQISVDVLILGSVSLTNGAKTVFRAAQSLQDAGSTWGWSLRVAEKRLRS